MFSRVNYQEVDGKPVISEKPADVANPKINSANPPLFQPDDSRDKLPHIKREFFPDTRSYDRLLVIQKAIDVITEKLNVPEIGRKTLELCCEVIQFEYGNIVLNRGGKWEALYNKTGDEFEAIFKALDDHEFIDWMFTNQEYITISVRELGLNESSMNSGSILSLPMVLDSNGMGVCLIYIGIEDISFSMTDIEAIKIIVKQASLAIHYHQVQKELERKENIISNLKRWFIRATKMAIVGELAKGLTHEINNPLQIILGKIQVAKIETGSPEILKHIEDQSLRIASLLRSFSDIFKDRKKNRREAIELNSFIRNTLEVVKKQVEGKGIKIYHCTENENNIMRGDSGFLSLLILNSVLEAKKRMPSGGELLISTNIQDNNTVQIEFRDTAPRIEGIPYSSVTGYNVEAIDYGQVANVLIAKEIGAKIEHKNDENPSGNKIVFSMAKNA